MTSSVKTIVILARHGGTSWNRTRRLQGRTDISLSDEGIDEARRLSSALSSVPISGVYCSPLLRSKATAEILGIPHGLVPQIIEAFIEINFGSWEGKTTEFLRENFPEDFGKWMIKPTHVQIPGAEELNTVQKRVLSGFMEVIEENDGKVIAVVGHGGVNRVILLSLLDADLGAFWRVRQDNVCVNLIEILGNTFRMSLLNSIAHLETDYAELVRRAKSRL